MVLSYHGRHKFLHQQKMRNDIHIEYLSKDVLRDLQYWARGAKARIVDKDRGLPVLVADLLRSCMDLTT